MDRGRFASGLPCNILRPNSTPLVGRTPWSAADALVGLSSQANDVLEVSYPPALPHLTSCPGRLANRRGARDPPFRQRASALPAAFPQRFTPGLPLCPHRLSPRPARFPHHLRPFPATLGAVP